MHRLGVMVAAFAVVMAMSARAGATPITRPATLGGLIADGDFAINVNEPPPVTCAQLGLCDGLFPFDDLTFNPGQGQSHGNGNHPGFLPPGHNGEFPGQSHRDAHVVNAQPVPDAGPTGLLLGLAVAGLALMRRRVSNEL